MAITSNSVTATAGQTNIPITFPYIDATHIKASINGVATTSFSIVGSNVVLSSGATAGEIVKVYRQTPGRDETNKIMLVDFQDGSVLSESELDKACQQLLYLAQEADETGASSLPIDWDGNYTAQSKRIKDLSGDVSSDQDAATKAYVDSQAVYGGAASVPQKWLKTGADFSNTGSSGNQTLVLTSPTPLSDNDDLYVVYYKGAGQRPGTDFEITESGGAYTLTLKMGSETLSSGDIVTILNFGVARNFIKQPLKGEDGDAVALTVQRHTDGQAANLQEWVTEAATPVVLASVNEDGDAAFVDVTATGNAAITGTATVGSTLGVTGATTLTGGIAGNLNILTGALQVGGTSTLQIRQVVKATRSTSTTTINANKISHFAGIDITIQPTSSTSRLFFFGVHNIPAETGSGAPEEGRPLGLGIILNSGASDRAAGVIVPSDERTVADNYVKLDGTSSYIHWTSTVMVDSSPQPVTHSVVGAISSGSTSSRVYSFVLSSYFTAIGWDPTASSSSGGYITYEFEHQSADIYCIEIG